MKSLILSIIVFNFLAGASCQSMDLEEKASFSFIRTMAGHPIRTKCFIKNEMTYARVYPGGLNADDRIKELDIRKEIAIRGDANYGWGEGAKCIGEDYSYTPPSKWPHYGTCFSSRPTHRQGGGFFLTLKQLDGEEASLNCFAYALGTFGEKLERLAGKPMAEIQKSVSGSIDEALWLYFDCITDEPQDSDLVVYQTLCREKTPNGSIINARTNTHAGIFRNSKPNWNSPSDGTVEGKWGWLGNPYVFQSDWFFTPDFYGLLAKVYRIKNSQF
jgi:hypothetical protein